MSLSKTTQAPMNPASIAGNVEPSLRDTRHLAGRTPVTRVPEPSERGLALGVEHDPGRTPQLIIGRADGTIYKLSFSSGLNLLVEQTRHCVGNRSDDGWTPCPQRREADRFDRCVECHPLPNRDCVFNPRCTDCTEEFCRSPHEVYIAYYGSAAKVGMTRQAREGQRLVEQGADAWFLAATVEDRFKARNLEDRITARLHIPQSVRTKKQLERLAHPVSLEAIRADQARLAARLEELTGSPSGPLQTLPPGPGRPLPEVPVPAATEGHHAGRLEGAHARALFYRSPQYDENAQNHQPKGPLWALDLKRVVTHRVRFDPHPETDKTPRGSPPHG